MTARPHLALWLPALLLLATPCRADETPGLEQALVAFSEGRWMDALDAASSVGEDDAAYAKAQYVIGQTQLVRGDAEAAEAAFRRVLATRPTAAPAQVGLARALVARGKAAEAEAVLDAVRKASPKETDALRVAGEAKLALGETKEALALLKKAQKQAKDDVLVARALVEAWLRAEDDAQAEKVARRVAKEMPKHPMGPFLLGLVLERRHEDDEAIDAYDRALALDETFLDAHKNQAILCHTMSNTYRDTERVKKSMRHYERYFALGGHDPRLEETYRTTRGFLESQGMLR